MSTPTDGSPDQDFKTVRTVRTEILKLPKSLRKEKFQESDPNSPNGPTDLTDVIAEQARSRGEAYTRRRALQSLQRQQLDTARQYGLRARHASKEKP